MSALVLLKAVMFALGAYVIGVLVLCFAVARNRSTRQERSTRSERPPADREMNYFRRQSERLPHTTTTYTQRQNDYSPERAGVAMRGAEVRREAWEKLQAIRREEKAEKRAVCARLGRDVDGEIVALKDMRDYMDANSVAINPRPKSARVPFTPVAEVRFDFNETGTAAKFQTDWKPSHPMGYPVRRLAGTFYARILRMDGTLSGAVQRWDRSAIAWMSVPPSEAADVCFSWDSA